MRWISIDVQPHSTITLKFFFLFIAIPVWSEFSWHHCTPWTCVLKYLSMLDVLPSIMYILQIFYGMLLKIENSDSESIVVAWKFLIVCSCQHPVRLLPVRLVLGGVWCLYFSVDLKMDWICCVLHVYNTITMYWCIMLIL